MAIPHKSIEAATMESPIPYLKTCIIATALIAIFLFGYYYVLRRSRVAEKRPHAPNAGGAWPIIGHLPQLAGTKLPHKTLGALADKNGPIFTIELGLHQALVVSSWEMAKELFTTNDASVSTRPKLTAGKLLGYNFVMLGFAPHGAYWREIRKITTLQLLSNHRLDLLKHVRISEVEICLKELYKVWTEKKNGLDHVLVELKNLFGDLSLNVILRMVAGKRYFGATAVGDKKKAQRCQKTMRAFFRLAGLFVLRDAIPFLGWLDVGGHEKAMKRTAKELDDMVGEWLEEHRRKRDSREMTNNEEQDFMDVMLSVLKSTEIFAGYDSDIINKSTCLNIIAGGSDTITVTLIWVVSLLLNNKHVLKKAQDELDLQVGKERQVIESDTSNLIYLQAIVKEALRLYPPAPLSGPREITKDCIIGGYQVKKGTRVITNLWKIQTDPRMWPNPLEFRPERFVSSHKDVDVRGQNFELFPFGSGRRACPGTSFGLQMIHLTLASFLHAFDISTPNDAPIDMRESPGLTNMKATPLEVLVSPRPPAKLYV